jgi:hypothetical protein
MTRKLLTSLTILFLASAVMCAKDITGKWSGIIATPDGDFELFFNFKVSEDKKLTGNIDTGMSIDKIEKGVFEDDLNFKFEAYSELAQQTINYSGKIVDEAIFIEIVGFDMQIELKRVEDDE